MKMISEQYLLENALIWDKKVIVNCEPLKKEAHRMAMRILKEFALFPLSLDSTKFFLRSNKGGTAVSGEVTLTTEKIGHYGVMVQISQSAVGLPSVMYRAIDNRCDYHGYQNHFCTVAEAFGSGKAMVAFADTLRQIASVPKQSRL